jgi:hypothetical protein
MSHPLHHAISSARKHGGVPEDYQAIHDWFDETKSAMADMRHRAMRHHAEGIFWCEQKFGTYIVNSDGKKVPVRFIGEQHIMEDMGRIPTMQEWLLNMNPKGWMYRPGEGRRVLYEIATEKLDHVTGPELVELVDKNGGPL